MQVLLFDVPCLSLFYYLTLCSFESSGERNGEQNNDIDSNSTKSMILATTSNNSTTTTTTTENNIININIHVHSRWQS